MSDTEALGRAMAGCNAVIHLAGIVSERGSGSSFEEVNVQGTRRVVDAASAAAVKRLIYVSSLGAERGKSPYHESKHRAEELTRGFSGEWVVLRPGNVYGPGDEVISLLLKMIRISPVVPAIDGGEHPFQPMWVEDLAEALAASVDRRPPRACPTGTVALALSVEGVELRKLSYVVESPNGQVVLADSRELTGAELDLGLSFDAPPGEGYRLRVTAESGAGVECSGTARFDVVAGASVEVPLALVCEAAGRVTVVGSLVPPSLCPEVSIATPAGPIDVGTVMQLAGKRSTDPT